MLTPLRIIFFMVAAPAILAILLIFFSVSAQPSVTQTWTLNQQDIIRAKEILNNTNLKESGTKYLTLTEQDLNIALNYLLNNYINSSSFIKLTQLGPEFNISIHLPENSFGKFLNVQFKLSHKNTFPVIDHLKIGKIAIADEFASPFIENIIKHTQLKKYYVLFSQHIRQINVDSQKIQITYHLAADSYKKIQKLLTRGTDSHALAIYQKKLKEIIKQHDPSWRLSLTDLLKPLFQLAYQRSTMDNAIAENRIVIFIVSIYINSYEIHNYLPELTTSSIEILPVYLYKRTDMAKHFIGSAALTASGSGYLAHLLGLEKEIRDSQHGSGFSFVDLAADRAGMYFGEMATSSPESARIMQKALSEISGYQALPALADALAQECDQSKPVANAS